MTFNKDISALISTLGGTGQVASYLNIKPSAISNWKKLNKIPKNKQNFLLQLSESLNINIEKFLIPKNISYALSKKKNQCTSYYIWWHCCIQINRTYKTY